MGKILNARNFNSYVSWCKKPWPAYDLIYDKIPTLALRNQNKDGIWKRNRCLDLAIDGTLNILIRWQAYRPEKEADRKKIIRELRRKLPSIILKLQIFLDNCSIYSVKELIKFRDQDALALEVGSAVEKISSYKNRNTPMMASKILHFFFPELFPVWDNAWIKNKGLSREESSLPKPTDQKLGTSCPATLEYFGYLRSMVKERSQMSEQEYDRLEKTCIQRAKNNNESIKRDVVEEFFWDLTPILFEICLIGGSRRA